jgi:RNA polymerase subunit RPABC4/transcription elongation factor Spt4
MEGGMLMRCLRCDTVTDWDEEDECPNCGYSEGMLEDDGTPDDDDKEV